MFDTGTAAAAAPEHEAASSGLFRRMRDSLSKSRRAMTQQLQTVMFDPADPEVWERLEEALIVADCGVPATVTVIERLEAQADEGGLRTPEELRAGLAAIVGELMTPSGDGRIDVSHRPSVLLMTGVNGTGKTTTIGKLAHRLREAGQTCVIGAADTFRAAADRAARGLGRALGRRLRRAHAGRRPGAVAYDAVAAAQRRGARRRASSTPPAACTRKTNLMEELRKIRARRSASGCRARRTRCCWCSTPPPARTGCSRRGCSPRPWT